MTAKAGLALCGLALLVLSAVGCRSAQPNLRPPQQAEAFNLPPDEQRFATGDYPKAAFNDDAKKQMLTASMPAGMMGKGMGGPMGGMGGPMGGMGGMNNSLSGAGIGSNGYRQ